jgi:hypothetical protein
MDHVENLADWALRSRKVYFEHFLTGPESYLFFVLIPLYVVAQPLLQKYFASRESYKDNRLWWKRLMITYNLGLCIFSLVCAVWMTKIVQAFPSQGFAADNFQRNPDYGRIVYWFYISKYVEFADTFFLLLQKKQVSWLQWIHHIGAPLNVGLLFYTKDPGAHLFIILNGFIHTLLYAYYAATISAIKLPGKWVLTFLQITQFNVGFVLYTKFQSVEGYTQNAQFMACHLFTWVYVLIVEGLFLHFFYTAYVRPRNDKTSGAKRGIINSYSSSGLLVGDDDIRSNKTE